MNFVSAISLAGPHVLVTSTFLIRSTEILESEATSRRALPNSSASSESSNRHWNWRYP